MAKTSHWLTSYVLVALCALATTQLLTLSLGEPTAVPNTEPSSYFDVATAQDGRSAVAYNSGQASGGTGQIYLQRYDASGELLGDRINIPSAGSNQGPVHAEWLEPDLIAVTFWTYTSSHRRIELRIVNATDGSIAHSSVVVGDTNTDNKGQGLADLGGDQYVIVWNYTPDHPQLPYQGASAKVYDYAGNKVGSPIRLLESSTGSLSSGRSASVYTVVAISESSLRS